MTRLMTSWACGSRAMARSPVALEDVVATTALEVVRALGEDGGVEQALVGQELLERVEPALVVARGVAVALGARDLIDQMLLELAPHEARLMTHRHGHAEDAALPRLVEDQLAVLPR